MSLEIYRNFRFDLNTTYGSGGVAKAAYYPENESEAQQIFDKLSREKFCILGNGSNVLAQDGFYGGSVIVTRRMQIISLLYGVYLYCGSGVSVHKLLDFCKIHGLSGLEYLSGIPATVGGACYMNAGAADRYICENVVTVFCYDSKKREFSKNDCNFSYKNSIMREINCIITGCIFKVVASSPQKVAELCRFYLERRKSLPKGKSCGCVFKNPSMGSAGALIDAAGLKGYKFGNAYVSTTHANFILNNGNLSEDVYKLIAIVKRTVYEKFMTELEEEVCYIGDF